MKFLLFTFGSVFFSIPSFAINREEAETMKMLFDAAEITESQRIDPPEGLEEFIKKLYLSKQHAQFFDEISTYYHPSFIECLSEKALVIKDYKTLYENKKQSLHTNIHKEKFSIKVENYTQDDWGSVEERFKENKHISTTPDFHVVIDHQYQFDSGCTKSDSISIGERNESFFIKHDDNSYKVVDFCPTTKGIEDQLSGLEVQLKRENETQNVFNALNSNLRKQLIGLVKTEGKYDARKFYIKETGASKKEGRSLSKYLCQKIADGDF